MQEEFKCYLHASEHIFCYEVNEVHYLKRFAEENQLIWCSLIGGCGSIKDIQGAKLVNASAIEVPLIESFFALNKFFQSLEIGYPSRLDSSKLDLFINIGSKAGIDLATSNITTMLPDWVNPKSITLMIDRESILNEILKVNKKDIELINYKKILLPILNKISKFNIKSGINIGIRGETTPETLKKIMEEGIKINAIQNGLLSMRFDQLEHQKVVAQLKKQKAIQMTLIESLIPAIRKKSEYTLRQLTNLTKYLN